MTDTFDLGGKRAIVTGGASGLGLAIALSLRNAGCRVACCDIDPQALASAQSNTGIFFQRADISRPAEVDAFVTAAAAELGGIDILVNNAAIAGPQALAQDLDVEEWQRVLQINLTGSFLMCKASIPLLCQQPRGTIVNVSSAAIARTGYPRRLPYGVTKAGLMQMTETLAMELGRYNINVNSVLPGIVDNARGRLVHERMGRVRGMSAAEHLDYFLKFTSMRTAVSESEVGDVVAFLCSNAARHISGQHVGVCGNFEGHRSAEL